MEVTESLMIFILVATVALLVCFVMYAAYDIKKVRLARRQARQERTPARMGAEGQAGADVERQTQA